MGKCWFSASILLKKAVKGFLAYNKIKFGKTHEMEILGQEVAKIHPELTELMKNTVRLTPFAVEFRYSDSADHPLSETLVVETNAHSPEKRTRHLFTFCCHSEEVKLQLHRTLREIVD